MMALSIFWYYNFVFSLYLSCLGPLAYLLTKIFVLFDYPIFWSCVYLMIINPEARCVH